MEYTEDIYLKNRLGGLKGRKIKPKIVIHHENLENPGRCFVRLFKNYQSLCASDAPDDALYLIPLQKPKENCWFKNVPIRQNKLSKAISNMCKDSGIQGYKTNHSLRATTASHLYSSGQLIMERTGHRSAEGVRSYKRTSMMQKQEVLDILNTGKKYNTIHETSAVTNASNQSSRSGTFNFHEL